MPLDMREVEEPTPAHNESVIETHAISINRGELRLLAIREALRQRKLQGKAVLVID